MTMDPAEQRDERVMSLVADALKAPSHERESFLLAACQSDPDLYREASEIVKWEEEMGDFLKRPLVDFIDLDALEQVFEPGQIVDGRFEIVRRLSDGGMGVVYEAFDNITRKRRAIKCPKPGYEELLPAELSALDVHHPNVCRVNEIHVTKTDLGEVRFLTMEFLDGETMADKLAREKFEEGDAWLIARQLCSGLAEAHRSQILHRDLKPGNVILCRDKDGSPRAVITDFGLAVEASDVKELEGGTPSYMAPELWRGGNGSPASDVFSLGVMLYEMVTGLKPFPALSKENVTFPPPIAPSKVVKNLPRRWDKAILPCLRENPDQRCSAQEVLDALGHKPWYQRREVLAVVAACLALATVAGLKIHDLLKPPRQSLVILPVDAPGDLASRGQAILADAARRIEQIQSGKRSVAVIPSDTALAKGVTTPEQASTTFGATHALQLKLKPDADDPGSVAIEEALIDLKTHEEVRKYSAHLAKADLADLAPVGLTGMVAWGLDLQRTVNQETVSLAAADAYKRGRDYLEQEPRDPGSAIVEFQKAAQSDPHSPLPPAGLAEAYARKSRAMSDVHSQKAAMDEAYSWLSKAEALDPDSPNVRLAAGVLELLRGSNDKALNDFHRVEKVQPNNVDAWLFSGVSHELTHSPDKRRLDDELQKAVADYEQAISADAHDYRPHIYLGLLYRDRGDYSNAEREYSLAHHLAPDQVNVTSSLAAIYTQEGRFAEAEGLYREALQSKETPLTLNDLAATLAYQGRDREALAFYTKAAQLDPDSYLYWMNLGDAQLRLHDIEGAKRSYQTGADKAGAHAKLNRNSALAFAYLAYFQARLGSKDAESNVATALQLSGGDDQVIMCAVKTYEALGNRKQAIAAATQASYQTLKDMNRRPDLIDLRRDPEFIKLLQQKAAM
jgi:serine/threonine protein kinase/Flp pilus assembly protein TadD